MLLASNGPIPARRDATAPRAALRDVGQRVIRQGYDGVRRPLWGGHHLEVAEEGKGPRPSLAGSGASWSGRCRCRWQRRNNDMSAATLKALSARVSGRARGAVEAAQAVPLPSNSTADNRALKYCHFSRLSLMPIGPHAKMLPRGILIERYVSGPGPLPGPSPVAAKQPKCCQHAADEARAWRLDDRRFDCRRAPYRIALLVASLARRCPPAP